MRSWASRAVQRPLGNDERIRSKKSGPSAGGEAPRPSKFELPRAGGGPTRLTKPPKLHSFRLRGSQIREVPYFREIKSGLAPCFTPYFRCESPLDGPPWGGFLIGSFAATDSGLSFLHRWRKRGRRRRVSPLPSLPRGTLGSKCCPCEYFCRVRRK